MAKQGLPKKINGAHIIARVKTIVKQDERIVPCRHSKDAMKRRGISWQQIVRVLKGNFSTVIPPHQNTRGEWELTVEGRDSGEHIRIGLVLKEDSKNEYVLVITVFAPQPKRKASARRKK